MIAREVEYTSLRSVVLEAIDLAEAGRYADGYALLADGLRDAERALEFGELWQAPLVDRWRLAISRYERRFGVWFQEEELAL